MLLDALGKRFVEDWKLLISSSEVQRQKAQQIHTPGGITTNESGESADHSLQLISPLNSGIGFQLLKRLKAYVCIILLRYFSLNHSKSTRALSVTPL